MNQNSKPSYDARQVALDYLSEIFFELVSVHGRSMSASEDLCIQAGHLLMSEAYAQALEQYDTKLCSNLPVGVYIHDIRKRTLATKMGDVTFRLHRCRDKAKNSIFPLADALDIPWNARVSPGARAFLVCAGADVSFVRSANLLSSAGGSYVSPTTVMKAIHLTGQLCKNEDENAAKSLYHDGVLPNGSVEAKDICIEADGTWIKLQHVPNGKPQRIEIKALVSYAGKQQNGNKTKRTSPIRHGCVAHPNMFWPQGVATIASRFDLSKVECAHFGCDGESFYKTGQDWLPAKVKSDTHLDPFHVNRAVHSCFPADQKKLADNILGTVIDGDVEVGAALIEAACDFGLTKGDAMRIAGYLRNNKEIIYTQGPSLGTMESEQQHVYGARMDSVPCAWSVQGVDAMARIRSRKFSRRRLPVPSRTQSLTPRRRAKTERRRQAYDATRISTKIPITVGSGTEAEHVASLASYSADVRYAAAIDSGMVGIGW